MDMIKTRAISCSSCKFCQNSVQLGFTNFDMMDMMNVRGIMSNYLRPAKLI